MQYVQIQEVLSHKHLGIYLSKDCSWHDYISYIKEKAWLRLNVMRKLKYKLDRKSLETIYIAFIRPLLEYGFIVAQTRPQKSSPSELLWWLSVNK